ncbi:uncharacterized protein LOC121394677 [Xenopus laevis]|uniref:Uncharacterized protein LOC121394677 n=1 Tax=Xenopus laevis TaxID=8355 RepID=A0A8J1KXZ2_XENLA|nr:uncharacterized protein LOC121394677 [Xenopus laevis]
MESVSPGHARPGRANPQREAQALGPTLEGVRSTRKVQTRSKAAGSERKGAARRSRSVSLGRISSTDMEDLGKAAASAVKTPDREVKCVMSEREGRKEIVGKERQMESKAEIVSVTNMEGCVQNVSSDICVLKHKMETSQHFISPDLFASMKSVSGEDCEFAGGEAAQSKPSKQSGAEYAAAALHHAADMQSPVADCGGGMAASKTSPERHQAPHALVTKTASCAGVRVVSGAGVESGEAVGTNSSSHIATPSVEMYKSLTGNSHLGTPTSEGNNCSDINEQPQAESLLKGQYAGSSHNQDQTPTTDELVELIKLANEQELQRKKFKVELQKAFYNYSTADVEKQDFYLAKVNKINEEFRTLEKQILQNYKKIGPLSEVYTNRRRFEDSRQALKQPAKYRSMRQIASASSTSDSDKETRRIGQLKPKKSVVAQIHAPNFIFSLDEANNIEDKMGKRSQSAHKEEESFVFSEQDFPSLPSTSQNDCAHQPSASKETFTQPSANNTETSAVVQSAPMSLALGHGKLSEQELTAAAGVGESGKDGVDGVEAGADCVNASDVMECGGGDISESVARQCVESVLSDVNKVNKDANSLADVIQPVPCTTPLSTAALISISSSSAVLTTSSIASTFSPALTVSPITTSPLTTPAVSQNPLPTVPSAQPSSVSAPVSSSVRRPNGQQSIPSESAGSRNVPPPPPPNAWNRPLNRVRVPGVQNNITGPVFKQKNVIRLRWQGDKEQMPSRDVIAKEMLLKQSTLTPVGVRAYIKFSDTEYDIVFKTSQALEFFWQDYDSFKHSGLWESFRVISITKPETKKVTILFKNDCVPPEDILIWLRRHCKVLTPLKKDIDNNGYWSGGWCTNVELYMRYNVPQHLPNSVFIGSERGVVFYPGQPRACFKCSSYRHRASACAVVKCSLCGDVGHTGKDCNDVKCNLCGSYGHSHRACPEALHNIMESCPQLEEEMAKDLLEEIRDEMDYFQSDSQPSVIPPSQPHDTVKDQSAVARDAGDSVPLTVSSLSQGAKNELPVSITEAPIIQPLGIQPLPQRQKPLAQSGKGNCEPADKAIPPVRLSLFQQMLQALKWPVQDIKPLKP